jgi:hypothetical protein
MRIPIRLVLRGPSIFLSIALMMATGALGVRPSAAQTTAPSIYNAYTGTDVKVVPPAPALGPANSVITDPTFGSRILRVTDANAKGGESFISTDSGFSRSWNANSTAIKLTGPSGDGYWLEFNPGTFQVGTGNGEPVLHPLSFGATWEWSAVQPNIIYYLSGNTIETYNTTTGASTPLASTPTGDPVTYMAAVIGLDNWVCAAAGAGSQDTYTKIFCVKPSSPSTYKFIDVANALINGAAQSSPNWPTSATGETIGIHDISGGTGQNWLEVTFHQQSWGGDGGAVFDLSTNTWSLVTNGDIYWSGHVSMGNGKYENASGSVNGDDSRGTVLRNPDNLMNSAEYVFVMQPFAPWNSWCDADHSSWLNSLTNPNAPILDSRYSLSTACRFAWSDEIVAAAVDGSNTVWRFAHNFNGGSQCYYAQAFAQISNDGNWALFSSYWGGTLGPDTSFGCTTRIDTFIVDLKDATGPPPANPTPASQSISFAPLSNVVVGAAPIAVVATASSGLPVSLSSTTAAVCSISGASATIVGAGTCSITASQPGNSTYAAAAPVTQTFTVTPAAPVSPPPALKSQTITFSPLKSVAVGAAPIALQAWTSSGLMPTLASTTPAVCSVTGLTAFVLAAGTCSITATQAGNSVYAAAAPVTQAFTVTPAAPPALKSQTITFSPPHNVTVGAAPMALQASTSSGLTPTLASTTPTVCSVTGMTAFVLAAGTCSITATQAGNSVYAAAAPVTQIFTALKSQTITFSPLNSVAVGAAPIALEAWTNSALTPTLASRTPTVCSVTGMTAFVLAAGTCSITATQAGNSVYAAAAPVTQIFTVTPAAPVSPPSALKSQTITFSPLNNVAVGAAPIALQAWTSSGLMPTLASTTPTVCSVTGLTAFVLAAGTCSITATQAGNSVYAAAAPVTQVFTVTPNPVAALRNTSAGQKKSKSISIG